MSKARPIFPGSVYLITRRCSERRFLMRPDSATTMAFLYGLAVTSLATNVGIAAFIANANHWHGVVVDRDGRLPEFLRMFHLLFAKHQNALRGRWENFWASEQTSVVELIGPEDIIEKCAYVLANPVKDHLVEKAEQWPGASGLDAMRHRRAIRTEKPRHFFRRMGGPLPQLAMLELVTPPGFEDAAEFGRLVERRVSEIEQQAAIARRERGICVMGVKRILRQDWRARPKSVELRRNLSPAVACRNKWARVEALQRKKYWLAVYRNCRLRYAAGERGIVFPAGTYALARSSAIIVAPLLN